MAEAINTIRDLKPYTMAAVKDLPKITHNLVEITDILADTATDLNERREQLKALVDMLIGLLPDEKDDEAA